MARSATIDINTEQAILGCIISNPIYTKAAVEFLEADDFGDPRHQAIFATIKRMYLNYLSKGGQEDFRFDETLLVAELKADKKEEIAGGREYVYDLTLNAFPVERIDEHAKILKNLSLIRHLFEASKTMEKNFAKDSVDYSEFLGIFEDNIKNITEQRLVTDFVDIKKAVTSMQQYYSRPDLSISTGYSTLDNMIRGFQPGNLIILAARPSVGKTALALNFLLNVASQNRSVAIFSLEMMQEQLIMRMLENLSHLNENNIRRYLSGNIKPSTTEGAEISQLLESGFEKLQRKNIFFDDHSSSTIGEIQAKARRLKASYSNLSLIVIDYIGLINVPSKGKEVNRQQEVAAISRSLKALARDLQVPVIALCQLSREVDNRKDHKPVLSDLRDSGAIEQDADQVFTLYRSDYYKDSEDKDKNGNGDIPEDIPAPTGDDDNAFSEVTLSVQKNRNGKTGEIKLTFNKAYCRFDDLPIDDGNYGY